MEKSGGYELRHRKNPPPQAQLDGSQVTNTKDPLTKKMEIDLGTFQMKDIRNENGIIRDSDDEDNTLFDQTSLTTPLMSRDEICASPDVVIEEDTRDIRVDESWWTIGLQVFFPFIIAGFGTVGAGMVLDIVQVSRLDLLVPIRNILSVTTKCPGENHDFVLITSLFVFQ
jgi:hypothetical protein